MDKSSSTKKTSSADAAKLSKRESKPSGVAKVIKKERKSPETSRVIKKECKSSDAVKAAKKEPKPSGASKVIKKECKSSVPAKVIKKECETAEAPTLRKYEPPQYFFGNEKKRLAWFRKNRPNLTKTLPPNGYAIPIALTIQNDKVPDFPKLLKKVKTEPVDSSDTRDKKKKDNHQIEQSTNTSVTPNTSKGATDENKESSKPIS